jgi:hypothetical protein
MLTPEQATDLRGALEPHYNELTQLGHVLGIQFDEPWKGPVCNEWTRIARPIVKKELGLSNEDIRHVMCHPTQQARVTHGLVIACHHFIEVQLGSTKPDVIDGTYIQFATEDPTGSYPHIMIAPVGETAGTLAAAGVAQSLWFQWDTHKFGSDVFTMNEA